MDGPTPTQTFFLPGLPTVDYAEMLARSIKDCNPSKFFSGSLF